MSGPDAAVRRLTREVGKLLRPYGFHGSGTTWTRVLPDGVARIGRTRIRRSWTEGRQIVRFGLTLSATPAPWWEFESWRAGLRDGSLLEPDRVTGPDLLGEGELPPDTTAWWTLRSDPERPGGSADAADVEAVRAQLPRRVHAYARRALRLLEPGCYAAELLAAEHPSLAACEALVVLLAEDGADGADGAGPGFEEACRGLADRAAAAGDPGRAAEVIAFARRRAVAV
ncbi:hypothetical protein ACWEVD_26620 [Nocardia thailandica]